MSPTQSPVNFVPTPRLERGLCNDSFVMVPTGLAAKIGDDEAWFLSQCHYKLQQGYSSIREAIAKQSPTPNYYKFINGRLWYRNRLEDWRDYNFPSWSIDKLSRVIKNVKQDGFILTMTDPDRPDDRALWYTIDYPNFDAFDRMDMASERLGDKRQAQIERAAKARQERQLRGEDVAPYTPPSENQKEGGGISENQNMSQSKKPFSENQNPINNSNIVDIDIKSSKKQHAQARERVKVETTPSHFLGFETMNQPYESEEVSLTQIEVRNALKRYAKSVSPLTLQDATCRIVSQGFTANHIEAYFALDAVVNFWKADKNGMAGIKPNPGNIANRIEEAHLWHKKGGTALPLLGEVVETEIDQCVTINQNLEGLSEEEQQKIILDSLGVLS